MNPPNLVSEPAPCYARRGRIERPNKLIFVAERAENSPADKSGSSSRDQYLLSSKMRHIIHFGDPWISIRIQVFPLLHVGMSDSLSITEHLHSLS